MNLLGIHFYKGTYAECLTELKQKRNGTTLVVTPNPEMLYEARNDDELYTVLKAADYALPDGAGIFVAYQIRESTLPYWLRCIAISYWCWQAMLHTPELIEKYGERITGSRLTRDLLEYAALEKIPVTIIDPVVAGESAGDRIKKASQKTMKEVLEKKFPGLKCRIIVSDVCPETINDTINNGIIFATHGNGKQEKLLAAIKEKFPDSGLLIGVGGSIDLLTGFRQPAPAFFQRFGGEWLYRLYKNPTRHGQRVEKVILFLFSLLRK